MHVNEIKIQQKSNHFVHHNDRKHDNDIKRIMTHHSAYVHRCQKNQKKKKQNHHQRNHMLNELKKHI